jgi:hypothetical protein
MDKPPGPAVNQGYQCVLCMVSSFELVYVLCAMCFLYMRVLDDPCRARLSIVRQMSNVTFYLPAYPYTSHTKGSQKCWPMQGRDSSGMDLMQAFTKPEHNVDNVYENFRFAKVPGTICWGGTPYF